MKDNEFIAAISALLPAGSPVPLCYKDEAWARVYNHVTGEVQDKRAWHEGDLDRAKTVEGLRAIGVEVPEDLL